MKKYELTTSTKTVLGRKLFQIKALVSFEDVEVGDLGGYIEKEDNLDHNGNAWILGDACVFGDNDHLVVGPIGSRKAYTTFYRRKDGTTMVACGCFHDTLEAHAKRMAEVYGGSVHGKIYAAAIEFAKAVMNTDPAEGREEDGKVRSLRNAKLQ